MQRYQFPMISSAGHNGSMRMRRIVSVGVWVLGECVAMPGRLLNALTVFAASSKAARFRPKLIWETAYDTSHRGTDRVLS